MISACVRCTAIRGQCFASCLHQRLVGEQVQQLLAAATELQEFENKQRASYRG
jgi:hypothetical protein